MGDTNRKVLRLGDCVNYPNKGELVGVHYILKDHYTEIIESTRDRGKIL